MTTTVVYAGTADGYVASTSGVDDGEGGGENGIYATARAGYALLDQASVDQLFAGQVYNHPVDFDIFEIYESFLGFDTSAIADTDIVSAATLNLTADGGLLATHFDLEARAHDWDGTLTTADWVAGDSLSGLTLLAKRNTSGGWVTNTAYDLTSEAGFAAAISKTGTTYFLLCSSRTTGNNAPTGGEYVAVKSANTTGTTSDPRLTVTHETQVLCGQECASLETHWQSLVNAGSVARDTTVKHGGAGSIKVVASAAGYAAVSISKTVEARVVRFSVMLESLPTGHGGYEGLLAAIWSSGWNTYFGWDAATGKFVLWRQGDWADRAVGGDVVQTNVWYDICILADGRSAPGSSRWTIDTVEQAAVSLDNAGLANMTEVALGSRTAAHYYTDYVAYYDDVVHTAAVDDFPIGAGHVIWGGTAEEWEADAPPPAVVPDGAGPTASAILRKGRSDTFTASAVCLKPTSGSVSAASIIKKSSTSTVTASAVLLKERSGSLVAAAILRTIRTATFAADAVVMRTATADAVADAIVLRSGSGSATADAFIQLSSTGVLSASAVVLRPAITALSAVSVIRSESGHSTAADAVVRREIASGLTVHAIVQRTSQPSLTTDAIVQRGVTSSASASAVIYGDGGAKLFGIDAVINRTQAASISTDAVLRALRSATFTAGAVRRATASETIGTDAVILKTASAQLTANAVKLAPRTVGVTADAVTLSPRTGSVSADALITGPTGNSFTARAILFRTQSGSLTAGAIRRIERTSITSADAHLLASSTKTFEASAIIVGGVERGFVAEAVLRGESANLLTAAALLRRSSSITFTAGAITRRTASASFSASAVLLFISHGFTLNATIRGLSEFTFGAAAVITVRRPKRILADISAATIAATVSVAAIAATILTPDTIAATLAASTITARVAAAGTDATLDVVFPSFTASAVIV